MRRLARSAAAALLLSAMPGILPFFAGAQTTKPPARPESCVGIVDPEASAAEGAKEPAVIEAAVQTGAPEAVAQTAANETSAAAPAPTRIEPAVPNAASDWTVGVDSTFLESLKKGGYILFFRHSLTNWSEKDQTEGDFANRTKQRNLSPAGQRQAANLGFAIKALEVPIERVLASPMWRCRDTAEFAFGAYDTTGMLFWKGPQFREQRIKLLSTPPSAGKNLVLVGHQDQLLPIVPGLKRDQLAEGDALVFEPRGKGKFRVVRQVTPVDWAQLAGLDLSAFTVQDTAPADSTKPESGPASKKQGASKKTSIDNR
jgi:phosphohistidine phosphatase SixA